MWRREDLRDELLARLEPLRRVWAVSAAAWALEKARPRAALRTSDELAFMPAAIEILETPASPAGRAVAISIMAFVTITLAWATVGEVDIHATAQGRVIPAGRTKPVAPPETAAVAAIYVQDGDRVKEGQVLVDLDPTGPQSDAVRLLREQREYIVTAARLRALLDGKDEITFEQSQGIPAELAAVHQAQLRQKLQDHRATVEAMRRERDQKEATARSVEAEVTRLAETVPLMEERAKAREGLAARGFGTRDDYLSFRQEYLDRKQALDKARFNLKEAEAGIANVKERLNQTEAQFRGDALAQLADAEQKAASLAQDLAKAEQRSRLYKLTAPVDGVIQQMTVHAAGAIVAQAQPILLVVPDNDGIAIEAALENKDAGFVIPGQMVEIKIESFPFTRYGTIPGEVSLVSSDAVQNGDSDPTQRRPVAAMSSGGQTVASQGSVYAVRVNPLTDHIRADQREIPLTPGMAVTAEIKIGRRRVIDYVLDPVLRYRDESLRER